MWGEKKERMNVLDGLTKARPGLRQDLRLPLSFRRRAGLRLTFLDSTLLQAATVTTHPGPGTALPANLTTTLIRHPNPDPRRHHHHGRDMSSAHFLAHPSKRAASHESKVGNP